MIYPARFLPGTVQDQPDYRWKTEEKRDMWFPMHEGAAIWQFPGDSYRAMLMAEMQYQGIKVILETDDNYYMRSPFMKNWGIKLGSMEHTLEAHALIVNAVDAVIASTPTLAKVYRKHHEKVFVCPNQIDPGDWEPIEKRDDGILRIGWTGSPSHMEDCKLVLPALKWAAEQPNVEVHIYGIFPRDTHGKQRITGKFRQFDFCTIPYSDLHAYRNTITQNLDIGLAPVKETPWAVSRSDVKALEYGMAGVCPVLSAVPPYSEWQNGQGCFKARNAGDFKKILKDLVRSPHTAREMAAEAKQYILEHRTYERNIWRWEEAVA